MTCIVAIAEEGVVYMGADSAGISGLSISNRKDPKIYKVENFLIGFTSSFRMGQILGYKLKPPIHDNTLTVEEYMINVFVEEVRKVLKEGGYSKTVDGQESSGDFLVGYQGRIFCIYSDFQVAEDIVNFSAIGCGADIALGSLYTSVSRSPKQRIAIALQAAEKFSAGVSFPFIYEEVNTSYDVFDKK